jgi:hypothetical protein
MLHLFYKLSVCVFLLGAYATLLPSVALSATVLQPRQPDVLLLLADCKPIDILRNLCFNLNNFLLSSFLIAFAIAYVSIAGHGSRAVWGMNGLLLFGRWDRGFKSHSRHECLCVFILCLCCSVCR